MLSFSLFTVRSSISCLSSSTWILKRRRLKLLCCSMWLLVTILARDGCLVRVNSKKKVAQKKAASLWRAQPWSLSMIKMMKAFYKKTLRLTIQDYFVTRNSDTKLDSSSHRRAWTLSFKSFQTCHNVTRRNDAFSTSMRALCSLTLKKFPI